MALCGHLPISGVNFWWMCPAVTLIRTNEKIHLWWHPPPTPCLRVCILMDGEAQRWAFSRLCTLHYSLQPIFFFLYRARVSCFARVEKRGDQFRNKWFRPSQMILINVEEISEAPYLIYQSEKTINAHFRINSRSGSWLCFEKIKESQNSEF